MVYQIPEKKNWLLKWDSDTSGHKLILLKCTKRPKPLRIWTGGLAVILKRQMESELQGYDLSVQSLRLGKIDVQRLLIRVTVAYQRVLCGLSVHRDLYQNGVPVNQLNTHILLQIRLATEHLNKDCLCNIIQQEGLDDVSAFEACLQLLHQKHLIQLISLPDNAVFIDKNPEPHAHIYLRKRQILMDVCDFEQYCESQLSAEDILLCD
ncbi:hypothetical protein [Marinicella sp. W31]|uniref:hypothetical protein n=1 Tax=Marinicella sp. W31 TaxID=3023713 RepID=UPI0037571DBA